MTTGALERVIRRSSARHAERRRQGCQLCAAALPGDHAHMLDTEAGLPLCVCDACRILFDRPAAGGRRYRPVPERRLRLAGVDPARLGVPVGLAFFVVSAGGAVAAHYPSPAGATRWEVDGDDWEAARRDCPGLDGMAPDVEALLVNTARGRADAWIVPVTDCYRLVGVVRQHWQGLSGGTRVWERIDEFFDQLRRSDGKDTGR